MRVLMIGGLIALGSSCASAQEAKFNLNADEAPDDKPWTQPASFTYTKDKGDKAAIALDIAARLDWRLGDPRETTNTGFARLVAHSNTATGSQVESYEGEVGFHFEPDTVPTGSTDSADFANAWFFFNDLSLGDAYKTNFDDEKDGCDVTPKPAGCLRSHESSLRVKWTVLPFRSTFESVPAFIGGNPSSESPPIAYSFAPVITVFTDQVVAAKVDSGGVEPKGNVSGAAAALKLALSPKVFGYRLVLRASVLQTQVFERASHRQSEFRRSNTLGMVSLDYELGPRSFEDRPGLVPSIGISYTKGDDPLSGKLNQEETVLGFKLTYKGV